MNNPLISIVIPVYNGEKYVAEAINSAFSQTYKNFEIIVINDGSTDKTENRLQSYMSRITYVKQLNRGVGVARNVGIKIAGGEWIAFLDHDDIWKEEKLEKQVEYIENNPDIDLVHAGIENFNETGIIREDVNELHDFRAKNRFRDFLSGNRVYVQTVVVKKNLILRIGLFDESSIVSSCEDYDLWIRLSKIANFGYLPYPLTRYRVHSDQASKRIGHMLEAELYVIRKSKKIVENLNEWLLYQKAYSMRLENLAYFLVKNKSWSRGSTCYLKSILNCPLDRLFIRLKGFIKAMLGASRICGTRP